MITDAIRSAGAERISRLRQACLDRKSLDRERELQRAKRHRTWCNRATLASLKASAEEPSWQVRRGMLTCDRLAAFPFALGSDELLAGRQDWERERCEEEADFERIEADLNRDYPYLSPGGQTGHCELDLSQLLEKGVDALAADIDARRRAAHGEDADTLRSFLLALDGFSAMATNAAAAADSAAAEADEARRAELAQIATACRNIARKPPADFREALQAVWFATLGVMYGEAVGLVVPGHLDRDLWSFYRRDLDSGAMTQDEALLLLECFYILINEFVPDGLAMAVMVGGRDVRGEDRTNELSYLCLEALRRTNLVYPTVGICWHEGTPEDLTRLAVELIGKGYSTPAFFGDEVIQRGLKSYGVPDAEACRYINSTCVEITVSGASNIWVASPYFSVCELLTEEIAAQAASNAPAENFEAFFDSYKSRLGRAIAEGVEEQNRRRELRRAHGGKPLQSVFTRDCIARARDIDNGGATYNWVECSFVGLANLADSLQVVRAEVYRDGVLTLAALKEILDADFAGGEEVRQRFLQRHPKYGNSCAEVDAFVQDVVQFARSECVKHKMLPDGSPFVPGAFCWTQHRALGARCGATPDGRRAGFPFADGCGPAQGRESRGPTAAVLSTTSWDHAPLMGGAAFNMKFNTSLFGSAESFDRLRDLVVTFLRRGGLETQINVVDHNTLKMAKENPEEYRDLVVRIGGYTDYFTRLAPEMQDEVMQRTEYGSF